MVVCGRIGLLLLGVAVGNSVSVSSGRSSRSIVESAAEVLVARSINSGLPKRRTMLIVSGAVITVATAATEIFGVDSLNIDNDGDTVSMWVNDAGLVATGSSSGRCIGNRSSSGCIGNNQLPLHISENTAMYAVDVPSRYQANLAKLSINHESSEDEKNCSHAQQQRYLVGNGLTKSTNVTNNSSLVVAAAATFLCAALGACVAISVRALNRPAWMKCALFFTAGVLLGTCLLHLLPDAEQQISTAMQHAQYRLKGKCLGKSSWYLSLSIPTNNTNNLNSSCSDSLSTSSIQSTTLHTSKLNHSSTVVDSLAAFPLAQLLVLCGFLLVIFVESIVEYFYEQNHSNLSDPTPLIGISSSQFFCPNSVADTTGPLCSTQCPMKITLNNPEKVVQIADVEQSGRQEFSSVLLSDMKSKYPLNNNRCCVLKDYYEMMTDIGDSIDHTSNNMSEISAFDDLVAIYIRNRTSPNGKSVNRCCMASGALWSKQAIYSSRNQESEIRRDATTTEIMLCNHDMNQIENNLFDLTSAATYSNEARQARANFQPSNVAISYKRQISCLLLLIALSFHSLVEGIALGASQEPFVITFAIVAHKAFSAFSLGINLLTGGASRRMYVAEQLTLALMTPIGVYLGWWTLHLGTQKGPPDCNDIYWKLLLECIPGACAGIGGGTFLHVALCEILVPELHRTTTWSGTRSQTFPHLLCHLLCCSIGITIMAVLAAAIA